LLPRSLLHSPFRQIPSSSFTLSWRHIRGRIKPPAFKPFVSPDQNPPELSIRALLLGSFFGVIFGAVTVYVGLRAGLTVAASIPISVLSISILRVFGRASILENNIVQTTGNAGQSIASGVIFTLPALVFLGFDLEYSRIFMLALIGGWLGVLFMIPLRRQLIVEEHGNLPYPEGTACADVLMAGEARRFSCQPRLSRTRTRRPLHLLPK
jgi:putative OPT family oligopeptide transporter